MSGLRATGLVLAAGGSRRLGQPKQLLPFAGRTLLDATLDAVRGFGLDQRIVTIGGSADDVLDAVDLDGFEVVRNVEYADGGCSSSIVAALEAVDEDSDGIVLLLGDQPHVTAGTVAGLLAKVEATRRPPIAVTRYDDGIGHPFWLGRALFPALAALHGDKGVWKLVDAAGNGIVRYDAPGDVPGDADTWEDYQALLALDAARQTPETAR